jgi:hypothetical protein
VTGERSTPRPSRRTSLTEYSVFRGNRVVPAKYVPIYYGFAHRLILSHGYLPRPAGIIRSNQHLNPGTRSRKNVVDIRAVAEREAPPCPSLQDHLLLNLHHRWIMATENARDRPLSLTPRSIASLRFLLHLPLMAPSLTLSSVKVGLLPVMGPIPAWESFRMLLVLTLKIESIS